MFSNLKCHISPVKYKTILAANRGQREGQPDPDLERGPPHKNLFEGSIFLCALLFNHCVMPLPPNSPFDSCLFCVALTKERGCIWRKQDIKVSKRLMHCIFFHWDLLCVSPTVTLRCFRCRADVFVVEIGVWKGGTGGYRDGLCLCFVVALCFCRFGVVPFLLFISSSWIPQT